MALCETPPNRYGSSSSIARVHRMEGLEMVTWDGRNKSHTLSVAYLLRLLGKCPFPSLLEKKKGIMYGQLCDISAIMAGEHIV